MERRTFVKAGVVAGALGSGWFGSALGAAPAEPRQSPGPDDDRHLLELRSYELRSDANPGRLRTFFREQFLPAAARAGIGPIGIFTPETGLTQSVALLIDHGPPANMFAAAARLDADATYQEAVRAFEVSPELPFVRYEARLMRAFSGHKGVEVPPAAAKPRLFELRTYESRSATSLAHKVDMFNQAEIALFRSIGMTPVFFGENLFGTRLPSLTYMLTFDDMAARTKAWDTFRSHPEWQKISKDPRWSVDGAVTASNVAFLNPAGFSPIR